jgi:stearoyl-CoA desaturase (delta-9 desaturase)
MKTECATEIAKLKEGAQLPAGWNIATLRRWLHLEPADMKEAERAELDRVLTKSERLQTVFRMRQELTAIWGRSTASREQLLEQLQAWCRRAEESGIPSLRDFSLRLRSYA